MHLYNFKHFNYFINVMQLTFDTIITIIVPHRTKVVYVMVF